VHTISEVTQWPFSDERDIRTLAHRLHATPRSIRLTHTLHLPDQPIAVMAGVFDARLEVQRGAHNLAIDRVKRFVAANGWKTSIANA
jgi:hypothetical protein